MQNYLRNYVKKWANKNYVNRPPKNQDYSLAKKYVENYITQPNSKIVIKNIRKYWNTLWGDFSLAEELFVTAKITEENIHFSKFAEIRDYLKFRINQLETRIERYIYLVQGITIVLVVGLLVNISVNNPEILMTTRILSVSLFLIIIVAIHKIFSSQYLLGQYRLIQPYFDLESVEKWLKS